MSKPARTATRKPLFTAPRIPQPEAKPKARYGLGRREPLSYFAPMKEIAQACRKNPRDVWWLVTETDYPPETIAEAIGLGIRHDVLTFADDCVTLTHLGRLWLDGKVWPDGIMG